MAKTALIIGASKGLGLGLTQRFREAGWDVVATCRDDKGAAALGAVGGVRIERVDINAADSREALCRSLQGQSFDLVFVNAGISGPAQAELGSITAAEVGGLFFTNAVAPLQLAEALLPQLKPGGRLGFMSSIMGSLALAQPYTRLYGASKAALNHLVQSFAAGLGEACPPILCLHPGWVRTDMGGEDALIDVDTSTRGLYAVLSGADSQPGVRFIDYQGESLPW